MRRGIKIAVMALLVVMVASLSMIGCGAPEAEEEPAVEEPAAEVFKVNYSTEIAELSFAFANYYNPYKDEVERRSGGRIEIVYYPSETLHKWSEFPEGCGGGLSDMACTIPSRRWDKFPLGMYSYFPGNAVHEYEHGIVFWKYMKEVETPHWDAINCRLMSMNITEFSWFIAPKKKVRGIEDLKGILSPMTIRDVPYLSPLGMIPVSGIYVDYYEMFQKGMIDAARSLRDVITRMKWHTLAVPGKGCFFEWPVRMWGPSGGVAMAANKDFWASLPPDLQEIMQEAADKWLSSANMQGNRIQAQWSMREFIKRDIEYIEWSEADIQKLRELAAEAVPAQLYEEAEKYGVTKEQLDAVIAKYHGHLAESQFDPTIFKSLVGEDLTREPEYEVRNLCKGWEGVNEVLVDYEWFDATLFLD